MIANRALAAMLLLLLVGVAAWGNRLVVSTEDEGYTSIQAAIDAALDGDTIVVKPGTYTENLSIVRGVMILACEGAYLRALDPSAPAVSVRAMQLTSIQGLTIEGANEGISVLGSCQIMNCRVDAAVTCISATLMTNSESVFVALCDLSGNEVGVKAIGTGAAYVLQTTLHGGLSAALVIGGTVDASIVQCVVTDCYEGITCADSATIGVFESSIVGNHGNGIRVDQSPIMGEPGVLFVLDSAISDNGGWAISYCGINGDEPPGRAQPIEGSGNRISGNLRGIICMSDTELPTGFVAAE